LEQRYMKIIEVYPLLLVIDRHSCNQCGEGN